MFQFDSKSVHLGERDQFLIDFSAGPKNEKGQIYFALDLPDNPGAEDSIAEKLWRAFNDTFFRCTADDTFLCFEESLKAINDALTTECSKRENGTIGRINGVAAVLSGNTLHFSQTGLSELYLLRGGRLSKISEEAGEEPQQSFIEIASGELVDEDRLVVSTRSLHQHLIELSDVSSGEVKRLINRLKSFGNQHSLDGVLSVLVVDRIAVPEVPVVEDSAFETVQMEADVVAVDEEDGALKKFGKFRVDLRRFKDASGAVKKLAVTMGGKMKGFVKTPSSVKRVNRRYVMVGIVFVVIVLGFFIAAQSNIREEQQLANKYQSMMGEVRSKISIAEQRFLIGEKADAHEFLNTASQQLGDIESAGFYKNDVVSLQQEIQLYRDSFDSIVRISDPFVLADLSTKGNVDALGLINTKDDKNFVYEPQRLFETILEKVQDPLAIDTEAVVIAGWEFEDNNALVFITQDGRTVEYKDGRFEFVGTSDSSWKRGIDIKTFSRFLYVLDTDEGVIWKYPRLRTRYGNSVQYNEEGDLRDAVSIAIDGSIYVLKRGGEIVKYNKGKLQTFTVKDQPRKALKNPTRIFTHTEANNLYVLDPENSRVVVYSKDENGVSRYQKQFLFGSIEANDMRDLYVDTSEQKIYVLTKDKIYLTDL